MTVESPARDIVAIQMLRGIAAAMVVFVHIDTQLTRLEYHRLGSAWLATGVDIFFVISGFIMWTSVERRPEITAATFLKNRIIRIVPLYWAVTTIVIIFAIVAPNLLKTTALQPYHAIASYLFLPARHPKTALFWPIVVAGWSLNYEMVFYAIFATSIALSCRRRLVRLVLVVSLLLGLLTVAQVTRGSFDLMNFYSNPILLEFVAGIMIGVACTAPIIQRSRAWGAATALGFLLLWAGGRFGGGVPTTAIAATMIVLGVVFMPPLSQNPLSALGNASYSLYLTHAISLSFSAMVWKLCFRSLGAGPFIFFSIILTTVVAFLVYTGFELPVTARLKKMFLTSQTAETSDDRLTVKQAH